MDTKKRRQNRHTWEKCGCSWNVPSAIYHRYMGQRESSFGTLHPPFSFVAPVFEFVGTTLRALATEERCRAAKRTPDTKQNTSARAKEKSKGEWIEGRPDNSGHTHTDTHEQSWLVGLDLSVLVRKRSLEKKTTSVWKLPSKQPRHEEHETRIMNDDTTWTQTQNWFVDLQNVRGT